MLHSCSASRRRVHLFGYTLLLADICGLKGCEHPSWCDDFAGETRFSQLLSFHRIRVASVCYMGSANIRYAAAGPVRSEDLCLSTFASALTKLTHKIYYYMINIIQILYCNSNYLLLRLTTMALYLS